MRGVATPKCSNVILQGTFVFEIRAANAKPKLPTVLLVCSPVTAHCKGLTALSAHKRLDAMLSLVMSLQSSKVLKWLRARMIDVVAASLSAAVAGQP